MRIIPLSSYEISIFTGDKSSAGTDSQVYITLFGNNGQQTEKINLKKSLNNKDPFERNQVDTFHVNTNYIGELQKIRIEHDNTGRFPGWFLSQIVITDLHDPRIRYFAICNKWLAKDEDDRQISRELILHKEGISRDLNVRKEEIHRDIIVRKEEIPRDIILHKEAVGFRKSTQYKITVYTGNRSGAGTDADIFINLFGSLAETDRILLNNRNHYFEAGQKREYLIECSTLGAIHKIVVTQHVTGSSPGWFLDKVLVEDLNEHRIYEFPYHKWLATDDEYGHMYHYPLQRPSYNYIIQPQPLPPPPPPPPPPVLPSSPNVLYSIIVYTGDKRNAGTDARVYIIMYNNSLSTNKLFLTNGKFENKCIDTFAINAPENISPLTALDIGHDNSGSFPGWFLDKVIVECSTTGVRQTFPCNNWLAQDEGDKRIERRLREDLSLREIRPPAIPWYIWIYTSDIRGASTSAPVILVLYGNMGKSSNIKLEKNSDALKFGQCDQFQVGIIDVGTPFKLRVRLDEKSTSASWHLDRIEMQNLTTNALYKFPCGRWLSITEDDKQIVRELPAQGPGILRPLPIVKYMIDVYTGNKMGAGTDANVFIKIYGEYGDTGKRLLEHSLKNKDKFEKNKVDSFIIEAVSLNQIKKIQIGHDGTKMGAGWFLDKVIIRPGDDLSQSITFICNRWLAVDEDDGEIVRTLLPSAVTEHVEKLKYDIKIKTGDVFGAGTDADVYLQLFGEKFTTDKIQLSKSINTSNKFERNAIDQFTFDLEDIGKIGHIIIGHNGKNLGAGWFLDWIEIDIPVRREVYKFPCYRWLDKKEGDGKIELELVPGDLKKKINGIPYVITVYTGDKLGAGTDANVFIQIYGVKGKTEEIILRDEKDNFERNMVDKFTIEAPDVGQIKKIRIGHHSEHFAAAWYLEKVHIQRYLNEQIPTGKNNIDEYWFICQEWFDKSKGDKQTVRELLPTDQAGHTLNNQHQIIYIAHVFTGDKSGAGTDANVYLTIYGEEGDTGERELNQSKTNKNKFERKQEDIFEVKCVPLGKLRKIKIRHDNSGIGSAWYLDRIEIVDPQTNITHYFICQKWLSTDKDDGLISREIPIFENNNVPLTPINETQSESSFDYDLDMKVLATTYRINVVTGKQFGAGTNSKVYIIIFGEHNDTGKVPLTKSKTNKDPFEQGHEDLFEIEAMDIDEPKRIKIGHDRSGLGSDWLLERVEIDVPKLGHTWIFPCGKWLNKDNHFEVELFPSSAATEVYKPHVPYEIKVYTSKTITAGTDANVFIEIFGIGKTTGQFMLCNKTDRKGKFQSGSIDTFIYELEDVGDIIEKIRIGHDNKGFGPGWHLDRVEIRRMLKDHTTKTYLFPCNRWLAKSEDDKQIVRELKCKKDNFNYDQSGSSTPRGKTSYEIKIVTTDKQNAGTTQHGWIVIEGNKTRSKKISLRNTIQNKILQRGQMNTFTFESESLGEIRNIVLGHEERQDLPLKNYEGHKAMWHVSYVIINDLSTGFRYEFPVDQWIPLNNQGDVFHCVNNRQNLPIPQQQQQQQGQRHMINYKIVVHTGNVSGAGTDANVSIILYGTLGDSALQQLKQKGRNLFERGQVDQFMIQCLDLGQLIKLHIEHDNKGLFSSDWFLNKVEVTNMYTNQTVVFPCNRWLAKKRDDHQLKRELFPENA